MGSLFCLKPTHKLDIVSKILICFFVDSRFGERQFEVLSIPRRWIGIMERCEGVRTKDRTCVSTIAIDGAAWVIN